MNAHVANAAVPNANAAGLEALDQLHDAIQLPNEHNMDHIEMVMEDMMLDPPSVYNRLYWSYRLPDDQVEQLDNLGIPRHFLYRRKNGPCAWVENGVKCCKCRPQSNGDWQRHLEAHVGKALDIRYYCPHDQCHGRYFRRRDALARHLRCRHGQA
ncbi:hypothetical protein SISSUDRAFT_1053253 [Sistotremastrum suecicum HHB10207 ss-3]|uniref:Uncharacterized protein n=1 Tax=Sistotremastrum suecicum HHB10207 ss-3 TaxID=1314776 RepID=A0A165ZBN6_9AGAM|nr:hypothetical protein SISSUDRAFT_1053253 [Sistotremastrum suecicum HHB10207 ss-3]